MGPQEHCEDVRNVFPKAIVKMSRRMRYLILVTKNLD